MHLSQPRVFVNGVELPLALACAKLVSPQMLQLVATWAKLEGWNM